MLVFAGCGKHKSSAVGPETPSPESAKQAATDHMPVYSPTTSAAPATVAPPNGEPDMAELNRSLLRWVLKNRRRPNNFEDFAATAGVAIPPPPAGKKYVLGSNMKIQLVSR